VQAGGGVFFGGGGKKKVCFSFWFGVGNSYVEKGDSLVRRIPSLFPFSVRQLVVPLCLGVAPGCFPDFF